MAFLNPAFDEMACLSDFLSENHPGKRGEDQRESLDLKRRLRRRRVETGMRGRDRTPARVTALGDLNETAAPVADAPGGSALLLPRGVSLRD